MRKRTALKRTGATPKMRAAARKATPPAQRPARDAGLDRRLAALRDAIAAVERTVTELEAMPRADVDALPVPQRAARARAIADGLVTVQALRNDELRVLNDAFEARLPALSRATRSLRAALARHDERAAFVDAAASAIGIVANLFAVGR